MDNHNHNPCMTVASGERKIVPLGVSADVQKGATVIVNAFAVANFKAGSVGFIMKNANLRAEKGVNLYLQVNTRFLAELPANCVMHDLEGVSPREFYDMPDWFWHRKDWNQLGRNFD